MLGVLPDSPDLTDNKVVEVWNGLETTKAEYFNLLSSLSFWVSSKNHNYELRRRRITENVLTVWLSSYLKDLGSLQKLKTVLTVLCFQKLVLIGGLVMFLLLLLSLLLFLHRLPHQTSGVY